MKLKEYLKKQDYAYFAKEIGVTVPYLYMLARDSRGPSRKLALKIKEATEGKVLPESFTFNI